MIVISVLAVAVVAASYTFVPTFRDGVQGLASDTQSILASGEIGSVTPGRGGNGAGPAGGFDPSGMGAAPSTMSSGDSGSNVGSIPRDTDNDPRRPPVATGNAFSLGVPMP